MPHIPYVDPETIVDPEIRGYLERARREGTPRPESQAVRAYRTEMPLQAGMQLEADIALEKRRLIEWALDPLFTLTGKWHG